MQALLWFSTVSTCISHPVIKIELTDLLIILTKVLITVHVPYYNMKNSAESIEDSIVETTWEEKDTDLVVQYQLYKKLKLESVDELSQ